MLALKSRLQAGFREGTWDIPNSQGGESELPGGVQAETLGGPLELRGAVRGVDEIKAPSTNRSYLKTWGWTGSSREQV